ncbi:MAG: glycosyltransferase [Acidobacteriota bacterium]|nr:glycosyltransferase [Acidobacteriota bacterium]
MKVSIITVCFNSASTIEATLRSVAAQTYPDLEHIVIDGASSDETVAIVRRSGTRVNKLISERDGGIYDAMNKGIGLAKGEIVGILNSDDVYAHDDVIARVVQAFEEGGCDACYGEVVFVGRDDPSRVVRYWKSRPFTPALLREGWFPPHSAFFVRNDLYRRFGSFDLDYPLAADVELMFRLLSQEGIRTTYLPEVLVRMLLGGVSNAKWSTIWQQNVAIRRAAVKNGIQLRNPIVFWVQKLMSRAPQFWQRPRV